MLDKWQPVPAQHPQPRTPEIAPADSAPPVSPTPTQYPVAVDVNVLIALIGGDDALVREFLHDFRASAARTALDMQASYAAGDWAATGALAHQLKSSSRSVGALALGDLCQSMETAGKAGEADRLAQLLPEFEQELARVDLFLRGFLKHSPEHGTV